MLHFFRKIRHDLIANSKSFRYFKYAIGEIVLVVLGILIALQINNQNELRKEQEKFNDVLVEVENELIWNTHNAILSIEFLTYKDSLCSLIASDELTRNQLEKDSFFEFRRFYGTFGFVIEDKAFKKLMDMSNGLTEEQDSIGRILTNLYNTDSISYSAMLNNRSLDLEFKNYSSLKKHDWFLDFNLNKPYSEKEIDYYLNDPEYKKNAAEYLHITIGKHFLWIQGWFQRYLKTYNTVYTYLENQNIQHNDSLHFGYNPKDYTHWIGKYRLIEWPSRFSNLIGDDDHVSEIELLNNRYYMYNYRNDSIQDKSEVFPISGTCFMLKKIPGVGFSRIRFNEQNEVIGIDYKRGVIRFKSEKIN